MESEEKEQKRESPEDPTTSEDSTSSVKVNASGAETKPEQTSSPSNEQEPAKEENSIPERKESSMSESGEEKTQLVQTDAETKTETASEDIPEEKKAWWEECPLDPEKDADFFAKPWFLKFTDERSNVVLKYFILKLTLPFVCASIVVTSLYLYTMAFYNIKIFRALGSAMVIYFVPPVGLEGAMPVALSGSVPIYLIVLAITLIDFCVGIFLVWNFDLTKKIPGVGGFIRKFEKKGGTIIQEKKWLEVLSFIGIALFVMLPFQGSGAVGGAIIGRALGMNPYKVLLGVVIGSFLGALIVALFTDQFLAFFNIDKREGL